jgi:hypothetical protein
MKFAQLGFDTKGWMLFIGFQNLDNIWLAMALQHEGDKIPVGTCSGSTQMKSKHYWAILV